MNDDILKFSLMGRFAYIIMCIESFLLRMYPERDWHPLAKVLWQFSSCCISNWMFCYEELTPEVALHGGRYTWNVQEFLTQDEYNSLVKQYHGITNGNSTDPDDELCILLNIPLYLMNKYDSVMTDGNSDHNKRAFDASVKKINEIESILSSHHIELPSIPKLDFLMIQDDDIWGDQFESESLSIILNKE